MIKKVTKRMVKDLADALGLEVRNAKLENGTPVYRITNPITYWLDEYFASLAEAYAYLRGFEDSKHYHS